tara:strand:- start:103 stop:279 length:177 start_codon:yes stop_codon:yes gene_type:complete
MKRLEKIRQDNIKKYGEICENEFCGVHAKFCRCQISEEKRNKRIDIIGQNGNEGEHYE